MLPKIRIVVATREKKDNFYTHTALGRCLATFNFSFVEQVIFDENKSGLPALYNRAIEAAATDPAILVFIHDDVYLTDFYWVDQIMNALNSFQIAGVAGSKIRRPNQPAWCFPDLNLTMDSAENLSGIVGHGKVFPPTHFTIYGPPCQEVKLLDGLLLIAHSQTLIDAGLRFDERFDFHFYDMDFCRQAEEKGISMGTWTLSTTHQSESEFGSARWITGYQKYLTKWKN